MKNHYEDDGEEFDNDFEFSKNEELILQSTSKNIVIRPPSSSKTENDIVLVRLSDLAQFGITINEIQESGMIFDPNGNKWVAADEGREQDNGIDLTGFDPSIHSEGGWDDEFGFNENKKLISPKNNVCNETLKKVSAVQDDDMDGFDDFEDHGEPIKLGNVMNSSDFDEPKKPSLSPKVQTNLQKFSENYDCDFDDDNTSHDLSILNPPVSTIKTEEDSDSKVTDFLKNLRLNTTNQGGPRLIRPEDVTALLQASSQKKSNPTQLEPAMASRTNMTISTLSDTLDDFDDFVDDLPNQLGHATVPGTNAPPLQLRKPVNRPASRGSASVGSTHEDTLSDRDTVGNPEEVENWDDGFDINDSVLSIHTIKPNISESTIPENNMTLSNISSLQNDNKKGKRGHHKKMKLITPADLENKTLTKVQDSAPTPLLMKFDSQLQKWVNNDAANIPPLEEVDWDDDDVLMKKSSTQNEALQSKGNVNKLDLGQFVDSLDDLDSQESTLKSHSGSLNETQERERISSMADFHIKSELIQACQREHDATMLAFLGEEEYHRLMHNTPKSTSRISDEKSTSHLHEHEKKTQVSSHHRKPSAGEFPRTSHNESTSMTHSSDDQEKNKRRKTPPRIRPVHREQINSSHSIAHGPPTLSLEQNKPTLNLKSSSTHHGGGIGTRKRKVFQDIWKLYDGNLPSSS